jgi:hypothetical protein
MPFPRMKKIGTDDRSDRSDPSQPALGWLHLDAYVQLHKQLGVAVHQQHEGDSVNGSPDNRSGPTADNTGQRPSRKRSVPLLPT